MEYYPPPTLQGISDLGVYMVDRWIHYTMQSTGRFDTLVLLPTLIWYLVAVQQLWAEC